MYIIDPIFERYIEHNYPKEKEKIIEEVIKNDGSCQKSKILTKEEKEIFITAKDMTPMEHLLSLAYIAKNTSLSVSKTINLPNTATEEDISNVYIKAREYGIIGVTWLS